MVSPMTKVMRKYRSADDATPQRLGGQASAAYSGWSRTAEAAQFHACPGQPSEVSSAAGPGRGLEILGEGYQQQHANVPAAAAAAAAAVADSAWAAIDGGASAVPSDAPAIPPPVATAGILAAVSSAPDTPSAAPPSDPPHSMATQLSGLAAVLPVTAPSRSGASSGQASPSSAALSAAGGRALGKLPTVNSWLGGRQQQTEAAVAAARLALDNEDSSGQGAIPIRRGGETEGSEPAEMEFTFAAAGSGAAAADNP